MLLRDYTPADLNALHAIDAACFPPGISYTLEELRSFITHRRAKTWVAGEGGEAVGFLVAHKTAAGPVVEAHIVTLDVAAAVRRRGVGSALMNAAEQWARAQGCPCVSLETAEDNHAAQAFYRKRGYEKTEMIKNYYGHGTSAWVMTKWIG
ncbi:MAG: GNAT family N-acetyltransferase [Terriglobia bacterium]